jgi:hypothetical protein
MHFAAWAINKEISLRSISRFFFGLEPRYSIVVIYTVFEKFSCLIYLGSQWNKMIVQRFFCLLEGTGSLISEYFGGFSVDCNLVQS